MASESLCFSKATVSTPTVDAGGDQMAAHQRVGRATDRAAVCSLG